MAETFIINFQKLVKYLCIYFLFSAQIASFLPNFGIIFSPHIEDFIDQLIAETNQGYANSEIPVTVTKLCQEMATVHDTPSSGDLLDSFMGMKESYEDRRNILLQICQEQTADFYRK